MHSSALASLQQEIRLFVPDIPMHSSACRSKKNQKDLQDSEEKPRCFPNPFGVDKLRIRLKVRIEIAMLQDSAAITHAARLHFTSVPHRQEGLSAAVLCNA